MAEQKDVALMYMEKYAGQLSKRALATIMHEENPLIFKTVENARSIIRMQTGNNGTATRQNQENEQKYFFHEGETEIKDLVYELKDDNANILILNDLHIPFHDLRGFNITIEYAINNGVDTLYLNGDTFDFYGESKFDKDPSKSRLEEDYEKYNDFLFDMSLLFKNVYFKVGNHENRYNNAIKRSPQLAHLLNVAHFNFSEVFNFTELGIIKIQEYQTFKVANKNIIHGHEVRGGGMFVARWLALRFFEDTICGHFHRTDKFQKRLVGTNRYLNFDSLGCMCALNPYYMPYNEWNHGFGHLVKDGNQTELKNIKIANNKIIYI